MFIKLDPSPIHETCERCGWRDASGSVCLEDDQGIAVTWCRQCTGDLFKSLLAVTLMPPVCDASDLALIAAPPSEEVAA